MKKILCFAVIFQLGFYFANAGTVFSCNAAFTHSQSQNIVNFSPVDSQSVGGYWNFGDGAVEWGFAVSHSYVYPGTYSVVHVVNDTLGNCHDSSFQTIQVNFTPGCSVSIQRSADSVYSGGPNAYPNHYTFTGIAAVTGASIKSWSWTVDSVVVSSDVSMEYTFPSVGSYQVCVRLETTSGCVSTDCQTITVTNTDTCRLTASYTYNTVAANNDSFNIRFTPSPDDSTLAYNWYFGDGGYSTQKNPQHAYANKGIYYPLLVIKKGYGTDSCTANFSNSVYVGIGPSDTCSVSINYTSGGAKPNVISFSTISGQPIDSEIWTISTVRDSIVVATLTVNDPVYTFTETGYYYITLKAVTSAGCITYAFSQIHIDSVAGNSIAAPVNGFPNPATNHVSFTITLKANSAITTNIYSAMGNLMLTTQSAGSTGSNNVTIPVQGLPSGMYYIEIVYGNTVSKSRFQKL